MKDVSIWIEFEEWVDAPSNVEEAFNVSVSVEGTAKYAMNAWPYGFTIAVLSGDETDDSCDDESAVYDGFAAPDIFVREMSRECVENVINQLIRSGDIEKFAIGHERKD